jgi:NlpC/P60 family putative phage cell wall peptidase
MHQASLKGVGCDCLGLFRGVWHATHGTEPEPLPATHWAEANGEERLAAAARRHLIEIDSSEAAPETCCCFAGARIGRRSMRQFSRATIA